ncbi:acyl-CoA synthetase family protein [Blattabacterium cuenoti]|uniref:AMP-binding protein n=1 Tax=Blattabacterium cuenoti TaxID=1653831 RepID=UPI00163C1039|nr:AMP-binding protein [Blattabacterium cuenoti]
MWIDFNSKKILTPLVNPHHPLYYWQESILTFLKNWYNQKLSYLISFTSGTTTGIQKKIFLKKENMYKCAKRTVKFLKLDNLKIKGLLCLSPNSIASKMFLVRAIIYKWIIYCIPPSSHPIENIQEDFDIISMVPMQIFYSLKKLNKIKIILIGGAPISNNIENQLKKISTICYLTYGMTETLGPIALKKINGINKSNYYQVFKDISINLDHRNCLKIFSPYIEDNYIQTNDIVNIISNNKFNWIGRYDNIINSGGIKIIPELIEKKIAPFIKKKFFISSIPDKILGEKIILFIEGSFSIIRIPNYIFYKNKFLKPKKIFFIKKFIKNNLGKIQRKKIVNKFLKEKFLF